MRICLALWMLSASAAALAQTGAEMPSSVPVQAAPVAAIPDNGSTQNDPAKSDDLWHTPVNGRGLAFSAKNPNDVALGLTRALANISKSTGTASAAAAASLAPTW